MFPLETLKLSPPRRAVSSDPLRFVLTVPIFAADFHSEQQAQSSRRPKNFWPVSLCCKSAKV